MLRDESVPPPRPHPAGRRLSLKQLWPAVSQEARQSVIRVLGNVILRRLQAPSGQEGKHDGH